MGGVLAGRDVRELVFAVRLGKKGVWRYGRGGVGFAVEEIE
jgi:hypothetical protein